AQKINEKMKRRHPHVFSNQKMTEEEVRLNWEKTKAEERKAQNKASLLSNLPASLPALQKAYQIGKKVSQVGFDWKKTEDVILKIKEELQELSEALEKKEQDSITEEMGDVLFSIANLCRFISVNPEEALRKTCQKFIDRFQWMERSLESQKESFKNKSLEELDLLWNEAKKSTKAVQKL
ncbi:MAG: MazG family protein, partial [Deltaproteobacteria bacterium]|nr:MazG family protein [Deltaproteobacteria bacterium]